MMVWPRVSDGVQIERCAQAFCLASARKGRATGSGEGPPAGIFGDEEWGRR